MLKYFNLGSILTTQIFTWTCSWPLAKCHISKLVCEVVRIKVFWIVVVRINECIFAVDYALEKDVNNPPFWYNNVSVRNLVILGADTFMGSEQLVVSKISNIPS